MSGEPSRGPDQPRHTDHEVHDPLGRVPPVERWDAEEYEHSGENQRWQPAQSWWLRELGRRAWFSGGDCLPLHLPHADRHPTETDGRDGKPDEAGGAGVEHPDRSEHEKDSRRAGHQPGPRRESGSLCPELGESRLACQGFTHDLVIQAAQPLAQRHELHHRCSSPLILRQMAASSTVSGAVAGLEVKASAISRRFGDRLALSPVTLSVAPGTAVALMGANGSGKTTLLRILAGRDLPSAGSVTLEGRPYTEDDEWVRRSVGVVAEDVAFYPDLSVREHLWLVASAHGLGSAIESATDTALERLRLADHGDSLPNELSSGQQQALLLATLLVRPRRMLLLDEPERRLDPQARSRLAGLLAEERAAGTTLIFATHHEELARVAADQVVVLRDGVVLAAGAPADIDFGVTRGE